MSNQPKSANSDQTKQAAEAARIARVVTDEAADAGQHTARASADIAQRNAETARQTMQSALSMATDVAERSAAQFAHAFGFSGEKATETARQSSRNIEAVAEASTVLAQGFQDISHEWASLAQNRLKRNLDGFSELLGCRTLQDLIAVQSSLMRDNLELLVNNSRRLAEMSVQVATEAAQKITAEAEESKQRVRRAA